MLTLTLRFLCLFLFVILLLKKCCKKNQKDNSKTNIGIEVLSDDILMKRAINRSSSVLNERYNSLITLSRTKIPRIDS